MVHVLSASVLWEHVITARGSVNACRGCHVFEVFHFRHYFPPTCRNSTFSYDAHCIVSKVKSCQNQKPNAKSLRRATPQVRVAAVATRRCELPLCQHSRSATTTIRRRSRDPPLICMLHHVLSQTFTQQSPFECHSSECTSYPNVVDGNLLK